MLQKFTFTLRNYRFSEKSVPWILLIACGLGFGVFMPQLGYYQDDWTFVYNHYTFGNTGIIDFLNFDGRPFTIWVFILGFYVLGYKPIAWHISTLVLKWLTTTFLWAIFRKIWPSNKWQNLTAALIFCLYPFFTLQPLAVTYAIHWVGYFLYALSIYFMLQALNKRTWLYTLLSILTQTLSLFTLEYFAGIDLLRPIFIWLALGTSNTDFRKKLFTTLKRWAPYLFVLIIYFIWRGFIYEAPEAGRNAPVGLTNLLNDPFTTLVSTAISAIPDLILILISSWYKILDVDTLDFSKSINRFSFLIGLISFAIFLYYLSHQTFLQEKKLSSIKQVLLLGFIALLFGQIPSYAGGYVIHTKIAPWNSRFSLGSLFGAALIITAMIEIIVKSPTTRWIIISMLLGLLVGWHIRSTNDFRWVWDKQVNFYRQLYLRAPALEPGTAILSEEEFLAYMGNYSTSYGINLNYADENQEEERTRETDHWFFTYAEIYPQLDDYLMGKPFSIGTDSETPRAGISFQGNPGGSIVISFEPGLGQCLWVMRPEYTYFKALSQPMRQLTSISHVERIRQTPENPDSFLYKYLYTNPEQDWCYFYEKADLAYQYKEWNEVIHLWEAANQNGLQPENGFEYIPFIEAFAHSGDWQTAKSLTRISQKTLQGIDPLLCNVWLELKNDKIGFEDKDNVSLSVIEDLGCDNR